MPLGGGQRLAGSGRLVGRVEPAHDRLSGLAAFVDGGDDEVGAADHVAAGEDAGISGLERPLAAGGDQGAAVLVMGDRLSLVPFGCFGREAEGDDHAFGRDGLFGMRDDFRTAAAVGVRVAEAGLDDAYASHAAGVCLDGDGRAVVAEHDSLVARVLHLAL